MGPDGKAEPANEGVRVESEPRTFHVLPYETAMDLLVAEEREAFLRIESKPSGSKLVIHSKGEEEGKAPPEPLVAPWEGWLPLGTYAVDVSAEGYLPETQEVKLERRKQRQLVVTLERVPVPGARSSASFVGIIAAYGVGALGIGLGAATGVVAKEELEEVRNRCGGTQCVAEEAQNLDDVRRLGNASTAGFVLGTLGVAAGTGLLLWSKYGAENTRKGDRASLGVRWGAGVGLGGFFVKGSF